MSEYPLATMEPKEQALRYQVQSWLMEEGWSVAEAEGEDAAWALVCRDLQGRTVIVAQKQNRPDQVIMNARVVPSPIHAQAIAAMERKARLDFSDDLGMSLLGMGVEFGFESENLEGIVIGERIYADALTKDEFLQRVSRVRSSVMFVIAKILRTFGRESLGPEEPQIGFRTD